MHTVVVMSLGELVQATLMFLDVLEEIQETTIPVHRPYIQHQVITTECFTFLFFFKPVYCPIRISPMGNLGYFPWGKPAAAEMHDLIYGACWVFQCFHNHLTVNSDMDYRIFNMLAEVNF